MLFEEYKNDLDKLINDERFVVPLCNKIIAQEPKEANSILKKMLSFSKQNNLSRAYPWFLYHLGWSYYDLVDFTKASNLFTKAYQAFEENNDIDGLVNTSNAFMVVYSIQQLYDMAIHWAITGLELAESICDYERVSIIKGNIAAVYLEIDEYRKAKDILDELDNLSYYKTKESEMSFYLNRAACEAGLNNPDIAFKYIEKATELYDSTVPQSNYSELLRELGNIYVKKGLFQLAEEKYLESINFSLQREYYLYVILALLNLAELNLKMGRPQVAIDKLTETLSHMDSLGFKTYLSRVYFNMNKAYKELGDYEKAYYYLDKYVKLQNKLDQLKRTTGIKSLDDKKHQSEAKTYKLLFSQLEQLYSIGQRITANLDKENILNIAATELGTLIRHDIIQIAIYKEYEGVFEYQLSMERGQKVKIDSSTIQDDSFIGFSIRYKKDVLINDIEKEYHLYIENFSEYLDMLSTKNTQISNIPHSAMFIPIMVNSKVIGVISTQSYLKNSYQLKDLKTLKILSTYIGISLENARLYKELEYSASYDALTKIYNRKEVLNRINTIYNQSKASENICLFMIDIDNFKKINDTYGHQFGDKVISTVSSTIKNSLRENDIVGRYGGEEFIVVLQNENIDDCLKTAERIRSNVENISMTSDLGQDIGITVSIGVEKLYSKTQTLEQLISSSDKALYTAKNSGKNRVEVFDNMSVERSN